MDKAKVQQLRKLLDEMYTMADDETKAEEPTQRDEPLDNSSRRIRWLEERIDVLKKENTSLQKKSDDWYKVNNEKSIRVKELEEEVQELEQKVRALEPRYYGVCDKLDLIKEALES